MELKKDRHLQEARPGMNIVKDLAFKTSNRHFQAISKDLKRSGKGNTDHHEPLTDTDLSKCYEYFASSFKNNVTLREKVYFHLVLHLILRGRENIKNLTVDHFKVTADSTGISFVGLYLFK
jgi:hypothetical protein